jgi:RND family efflux transporter MFP subunit
MKRIAIVFRRSSSRAPLRAPLRAPSRARRGVAAAVALTGALALAGCNRGGDARAEQPGDAGVTIGRENIAIVAMDSIQAGPGISGSLRAENEARVRAQVGGPVLDTYVEQGQRVAKGTVLARIDDTAIRDAYLSARSAVTSAESAADVARRELERAEKLVQAGGIAEREVESARRASVAADAALADSRARLASAQEQVNYTRVTAPFSGAVAARAVSAGDVVVVGTELFTVVDPSSMRLEASVPADQLSTVRVGAPVSFTVNAYPGRTFSGKITRVSPVADPTTRQVQIIASIPNTGSAPLVGGLFAEGRVASETRRGLVVPQTAIDERGVAPAATRLKNGRVERVNVELGIRNAANETIEVRGGLAAGDTVLVGAAQGISAGTPVRVGEVGDPSAPRAETARATTKE